MRLDLQIPQIAPWPCWLDPPLPRPKSSDIFSSRSNMQESLHYDVKLHCKVGKETKSRNWINQRSPNFLDAGPKSRSYQHPCAGLFCALKKTKQKATRFTLDTFVHCNLFSLFGNMFAMWLLQLFLLLHNSCNIWFHAWRCNTLIASTIFKNPVYLTNHWLDSRDVVET